MRCAVTALAKWQPKMLIICFLSIFSIVAGISALQLSYFSLCTESILEFPCLSFWSVSGVNTILAVFVVDANRATHSGLIHCFFSFIFAMQAICAGLLVLLSYVTTYWQLAILLVVYNSSAEAFFVLASTNIGLDLRHYFRSPTQSGSASPLHPTNSVADVESTPPLATNAAPLPQMLIAPASRESTIAASTKCGPPRRSYRVCLLFALGARYVLAFLIEVRPSKPHRVLSRSRKLHACVTK